MLAYLKCFLVGFIAEHEKIPFFFFLVRLFCFPSTVFWGAGAPVVLAISARGCRDAAVPLARMQLACSHQAAAKSRG